MRLFVTTESARNSCLVPVDDQGLDSDMVRWRE